MAPAFGQTIGPRGRVLLAALLLAALLRQMREDSGLPQQELSARLGVPVSVRSKMERGHRGIDVLDLRAICMALGASLPDFLARLEARLTETRSSTSTDPLR